MIEIKIDEQVSTYVEKLFYEQNAIQSVIDYLIEKQANSEIINKQIERYVETNSELEKAKYTTALKYAPKSLEHYSKYQFNFTNKSLEFYD